MTLLRTLCLGLGGAALLGLSSCSSSSFYPAANNFAPMLQEKGEVKVQGGLSIHAPTLGYDLKAAYAITRHLEVLASTRSLTAAPDQEDGFLLPTTTVPPQPDGMRGNHTELGVGLTGENDIFGFELTAGYGFLGGTTYSSDDRLRYEFRGGGFFLQPAIGFREDFAELIFSLRLSNMAYPEISADSLITGAGSNNIDNIFDSAPQEGAQGYLFLEPAAAVLLGGNQLKFKFQFGFSMPVRNSTFDYDPVNVQMGLVYNFKPSTADQGFMGLEP